MAEKHTIPNFTDNPEGMQHGPVPPPDLLEGVTDAQYWKAVDMHTEDPVAYQYKMMQKVLVSDHMYVLIGEERFKDNYARINRAIDLRGVVRPMIDSLVMDHPGLGLARMRRN